MPRNNEYTHGGSAAKNLGLLLRALLNLLSFGALWFALLTPAFAYRTPVLIGGAVLCAICFVLNLLEPMLHATK